MRISDWSSDVCSSDLLVGNKSGAPLDQALRKLPGNNLSNAPELVATGSVAWTPEIGSGGLTGLVYVDGRMTSDYNTGSDLFPQKEQDGYAVVRSEEHTSELQSLMRISYAVFCLKKKKHHTHP